MKPEIYSPDLFVESTFLARANLKSSSKREMVNLSEFNIPTEKFWKFLDSLKLRGKSGKEIVFKKDTTPEIAQLLGFIITDGCLLSTEGRVRLCQKDPFLLKDYLDIINKEYNSNMSLAFNGKEANISSVPLRYILHNYYGTPLGKKVRSVETPLQVLDSEDQEILKHFIAGLYDGDGYLHYYYLKNKNLLDSACFSISTSSHNLINQAERILSRLGIKCSIHKRNDGRLTLQTSGFLNSLKFHQQIIPIIFHRKRKKKADKIFLNNDLLGKLLVPLNENIKLLFEEIIKQDFSNKLLDSLCGYNYVHSLRTIESWTYPSRFGKIRSIYVYKACKLLNREPGSYLPEDQLTFIEKVLK